MHGLLLRKTWHLYDHSGTTTLVLVYSFCLVRLRTTKQHVLSSLLLILVLRYDFFWKFKNGQYEIIMSNDTNNIIIIIVIIGRNMQYACACWIIYKYWSNILKHSLAKFLSSISFLPPLFILIISIVYFSNHLVVPSATAFWAYSLT